MGYLPAPLRSAVDEIIRGTEEMDAGAIPGNASVTLLLNDKPLHFVGVSRPRNLFGEKGPAVAVVSEAKPKTTGGASFKACKHIVLLRNEPNGRRAPRTSKSLVLLRPMGHWIHDRRKVSIPCVGTKRTAWFLSTV